MSVGIIAGGTSKRFNSDKAMASFRGHTLLEHMVDIGKKLTQNTFVVVSNEEQEERFTSVIDRDMIRTDPEDSLACALTGALTAFEFSETPYILLLPVDTPLANVRLLLALVNLAQGHGAVVPSWPNGYIEPLHSVYLAEHAYSKGIDVMNRGKAKMSDLLDTLSNVLHVSTEVLKIHDPDLSTFSNINTERDLRALEKQTERHN